MFRNWFTWNSGPKQEFGSGQNQTILKSSVVSELCKSIPSIPYSNFARLSIDSASPKHETVKANTNKQETSGSIDSPPPDNKDAIIEELKTKLIKSNDELCAIKEKMNNPTVDMCEEIKKSSERLEQKEKTLNKLQESIGKKMMEEQRWRKKMEEHVDQINKLKEEVARLNEENDQLDADIKIGLDAEDQLQEKIDELESKLLRSETEKKELELQIEDQKDLFRVFELPENNVDGADDIEKVRQNIVMEHKSFLRRLFPNLVSANEEREYFEDQTLNTEWLKKLEIKIRTWRMENETVEDDK